MGDINRDKYGKNAHKNIILTNHAHIRSAQRSISVSDISECLDSPDFRESLEEDKIKIIKFLSGRNLVVIYNKIGNTYIIITIYPK